MSIYHHNKTYKSIYYVKFCSHNMKHFSTVRSVCMIITDYKQTKNVQDNKCCLVI